MQKYIIFFLFLIIIFLIWHSSRNNYESFWNLTPYEAHMKIFRCFTGDCIKKKSKECHNWCDNIEEPAAQENCRTRCLDYADQQVDQIKMQDYMFKNALPSINKVALFNDVEWF